MSSPPPRLRAPRRRAPAYVGALAALLLGPGAVAAEPSSESTDFTGAWRHVGGRAEKRAVKRAIDHSVSDMTLVLRALARSRLIEGSRIPKRVTIDAGAQRIAIRDDERRPLASPPGLVTRTVSSTGDRIELLHEIDARALVQYRTTPEGGRRTTYRLDPDGERLLVDVVTTSHYLTAPVAYRLTYERVASAAASAPSPD